MSKTILFAAFLAGLLLFGCAMPWDTQNPPGVKNTTVRIVPPPVNTTVPENASNGTAANQTPEQNATENETIIVEPEPEIDPLANLIPRNVSDRIGDGQFRLKEQSDSPLRVYVLDAGQADSVLITKGDFAVLIDEGKNVSGYIKKLGVKRLNIVVATHDYSGAIGALGGALDDFHVDEFWENGVSAGSAEYAALLAKARDKNITVKHPEAGDWFAFSGVNFTALNPQKQRLLGSPESDSVVMKLSMGGFCMLLLNPTVQERELALMGLGESLRCDVMTYFRHGEGRPEPSLLVSNAAPRDVVISVGNNSLGLPSNTTLTRLELGGVRVLRTDIDGTVRVTYDGFSPYEIAVQKDTSSTTFRVV